MGGGLILALPKLQDLEKRKRNTKILGSGRLAIYIAQPLPSPRHTPALC
jgi:hypothetical protein